MKSAGDVISLIPKDELQHGEEINNLDKPRRCFVGLTNKELQTHQHHRAAVMFITHLLPVFLHYNTGTVGKHPEFMVPAQPDDGSVVVQNTFGTSPINAIKNGIQ